MTSTEGVPITLLAEIVLSHKKMGSIRDLLEDVNTAQDEDVEVCRQRIIDAHARIRIMINDVNRPIHRALDIANVILPPKMLLHMRVLLEKRGELEGALQSVKNIHDKEDIHMALTLARSLAREMEYTWNEVVRIAIHAPNIQSGGMHALRRRKTLRMRKALRKALRKRKTLRRRNA